MCASWAERLQRSQGYRNPRRWEGLPDSTPQWRAGAWSSGWHSKLPYSGSAHPPHPPGAPTKTLPSRESTRRTHTVHQSDCTWPTLSLRPLIIKDGIPGQPALGNQCSVTRVSHHWADVAYAPSLPGIDSVPKVFCELMTLGPDT